MNRDDIIRMAREAGLTEFGGYTEQNIERFAALVAAAEREACAQLCEEMGDARGRTDKHISAALEIAAENIRERRSME